MPHCKKAELCFNQLALDRSDRRWNPSGRAGPTRPAPAGAPTWGSPSRCGSRACGSLPPWTAARDDDGSHSPTYARPADDARPAASPGPPGTRRPTAGGGPQSRQCRKPQPVGRLVVDPADLAAEDRVLVAKHQKLGVLRHRPRASTAREPSRQRTSR
jgi:hypothetical protein